MLEKSLERCCVRPAAPVAPAVSPELEVRVAVPEREAVPPPPVCPPPPWGIPPPEPPESLPEELLRWLEVLFPALAPFDSVSPTGIRNVFVSPVSVINEDEAEEAVPEEAAVDESDPALLPLLLRLPTASVTWLPTTAVTLPMMMVREEEPLPDCVSELVCPCTPPFCEQAAVGTARTRKATRAAHAFLLHFNLIKIFLLFLAKRFDRHQP